MDGGGCLGWGGEKGPLAWCQTMVCIPGIAGELCGANEPVRRWDSVTDTSDTESTKVCLDIRVRQAFCGLAQSPLSCGRMERK